MKKWLCEGIPAENPEIRQQFGELLGAVMAGRGINTPRKVNEIYGCQGFSDPLLLKDMEIAAEIIHNALDEGRKITVYADYDCDGVTSAAMLYGYLEAMGAEIEYYIPDRSEGYGMNTNALKRIIDGGTELIITVDNGISALKEAEYIRSRGVQLVITDHHQPPAELPVCDACVNPHRADDNSPFKELCGAGVVLKLLCALEEDEEWVMEQYSELAAVGTVGDVMPLVGENRYIVRRGLENIRNHQNLGLDRLLKSAGVSPEKADASTLVYSVCPRINAAGRMDSAGKAVRLFLTESSEQAAALAEELNFYNDKRREQEIKILDEVNAQLKANPQLLKERVLVVSGEGWHHGVIGIVGSRLLEKYGKPVLIIGIENGEARGSARGIDGFSIYKLLERCSAVLTKFGGHLKAGGFSLAPENVEEFRQLVYVFCRECYPKMPEYTVYADLEASGKMLTLDEVEQLSKLEPCGEGNKKPQLLLKNCRIVRKNPLKDGKYTSFEFENGGAVLKALCFQTPFAKFYPEVGSFVDIIGTPEINEYMGKRSVNVKVSEIRSSDFREDRYFAAMRIYEEICRGEGCDKRLAPRVIPDREALKIAYDLLKNNGGMSAEDMCVYGKSPLNICMLRIAFDVFSEAGMAEISPDAEEMRILPFEGKKDLLTSGLLSQLRTAFDIK